MRSDQERLQDILEAIEAVKKYASKGHRAFEMDELVQTWIVHHLLLLGEAASKLSKVFREQHPDVPWSKITGMRNILIHGYFTIDTKVVWSVIEKDLRQLELQIRAWLTE
jgi:uncharacterized protein with HEPN domain